MKKASVFPKSPHVQRVHISEEIGWGLVATRDFAPDEVIFFEMPLVWMDNAWGGSEQRVDRQREVAHRRTPRHARAREGASEARVKLTPRRARNSPMERVQAKARRAQPPGDVCTQRGRRHKWAAREREEWLWLYEEVWDRRHCARCGTVLSSLASSVLSSSSALSSSSPFSSASSASSSSSSSSASSSSSSAPAPAPLPSSTSSSPCTVSFSSSSSALPSSSPPSKSAIPSSPSTTIPPPPTPCPPLEPTCPAPSVLACAAANYPCRRCGLIAYCSAACRKWSWNAHHRAECPSTEMGRRYRAFLLHCRSSSNLPMLAAARMLFHVILAEVKQNKRRSCNNDNDNDNDNNDNDNDNDDDNKKKKRRTDTSPAASRSPRLSSSPAPLSSTMSASSSESSSASSSSSSSVVASASSSSLSSAALPRPSPACLGPYALVFARSIGDKARQDEARGAMAQGTVQGLMLPQWLEGVTLLRTMLGPLLRHCSPALQRQLQPKPWQRMVGRWVFNNIFGGVYGLQCTLNHSCGPNVAVRLVQDLGSSAQVWDPHLPSLFLSPRAIAVTALVAIHKGDPLLQSYVDPRTTRAQRQARLRAWWLFDCGCPRCASVEDTSLSAEQAEMLYAADFRRAPS